MKRKSYEQPDMRVIELRHQMPLLQLSTTGHSSVKNMNNSEGIGYVDEIDDTYGDN